jgi:hypothetical protein
MADGEQISAHVRCHQDRAFLVAFDGHGCKGINPFFVSSGVQDGCAAIDNFIVNINCSTASASLTDPCFNVLLFSMLVAMARYM